jgi:redox-sensitive bicupin YhaK (pirin superfamily)
MTMKTLRFIKRSNGKHWVGDGFPVHNIFSYNDIAQDMSPFLMLDYASPTTFDSTTRKRGVGSHPHRGIETVSIIYAGEVSHRDSAGAGGTIGPGDVQWMTAASGLVHEEFHSATYAQTGGDFEMVQLWVNLRAKDKMIRPSYQGITQAQIPVIALPAEAGHVRVIAGDYQGTAGVASTHSPMNLWDVVVKAGSTVQFQLPEGHSASLFVMRGSVAVDGKTVGPASLAVLERAGTVLQFEALEDSTLLFMGGEPLNEPVVGYGPFVMNTQAEIHQAFADFQAGRMGQITEVA